MISASNSFARCLARPFTRIRSIMDVILHIGAHRTGTTTLQHYLHRNEDTLNDAGVAIWTPRRTRNGMFAGLVRHQDDEAMSKIAKSIRSIGRTRIEISRLAGQGKRQLIVSEENMIGNIRDNLSTGMLYQGVRTRIERFVPAFEDRCTRIALSIRSLDDHWASSAAYSFQKTGQAPSPDQFNDIANSPRSWRHVIQDLSQLFPRAELVVWPSERYIGAPETQLSILTGLHQVQPKQHARQWFNRGPDLSDLRQIAQLLPLPGRATDIPDGSGRWMPFTALQRLRLKNQYRADLDWLRNGADGLARFVEDADRHKDGARQDLMEQKLGAASAGPPPNGGQIDGKQKRLG
jgi:hypothetical protein